MIFVCECALQLFSWGVRQPLCLTFCYVHILENVNNISLFIDALFYPPLVIHASLCVKQSVNVL